MEDRQDVTILVCCHKPDFYYNAPGFLPIQVGKAISNVDLGIQGDDIGDNISELNPNFCELTAHYWFWKNGPKSKYVGLNHYRRYFDFKHNGPLRLPVCFQNQENFSYKPPKLAAFDAIFKKYDIIAPVPIIYPYSIKHEYCIKHSSQDYNALREVIKDIYPEYLTAFDKTMDSNKFTPCNMFIAPYEIFDRYSEWLFDILFEVRKRIKISTDSYQARVFGFMAERLLRVFMVYNRLEVKTVPILMMSDGKNANRFRYFLVTLRVKARYYLNKLTRLKNADSVDN